MLLLKDTRHRLGVTQDDLETRSGVSRDTISRLERVPDPDPRLSTVVALADALGVPVCELVSSGRAHAGKQPGRSHQRLKG